MGFEFGDDGIDRRDNLAGHLFAFRLPLVDGNRQSNEGLRVHRRQFLFDFDDYLRWRKALVFVWLADGDAKPPVQMFGQVAKGERQLVAIKVFHQRARRSSVSSARLP